ncbi:MAG: hypothetical protein AAF431_00500 [Pseudomonadota bacterium]
MATILGGADILHINDNNLLIQQASGVSRSQGYAWLLDEKVHFDLDQHQSAVANCRLEPQQINSLYWQQCAQTAIAGNASGMRHAADLIWRHLSDLQAGYDLSNVQLVVPSHYQASNLQLLLGIARASGLQVNGLINKAVLALADHVTAPGVYMHVDVQLHQTVCTEVMANDGQLNLGKTEVLHEIGLQAMQDALLRAFQERFIQSDRFDPLHHAETEQQLFDQLSRLAEQIGAEGKANIQVEYQGRQHVTSIDSRQWQAALADFVKPLLSVQIENQVDHFYYDFNGFQPQTLADNKHSSLAHSGKELLQQAARLGGLDNSALFDADGKIIYCTQLAYEIGTSPAPQVKASAKASAVEAEQTTAEPAKTPRPAAVQAVNGMEKSATHLLQAGVAVPIEHAQISTSENQLSLLQGNESNINSLLAKQTIFIMSDAGRQTLQVDDRIGSDLADGVITVIQVIDHNLGSG